MKKIKIIKEMKQITEVRRESMWITIKKIGDKRIILRGKDRETIQSFSVSIDDHPLEQINRMFSEGNEIIVDVVGMDQGYNPVLADYIPASDVYRINKKETDPFQETITPITKEEAQTYVLETLLPSAKDALKREDILNICAFLVSKVGEELYAEVVDMTFSNEQEETEKINLLHRSVSGSDCQFVVLVAETWYVNGNPSINTFISEHPERKEAIMATLSVYDEGNITFLLPFERHGNEIVFSDLDILDGEDSIAGGRYLYGLWDSRKDKEDGRKWN